MDQRSKRLLFGIAVMAVGCLVPSVGLSLLAGIDTGRAIAEPSESTEEDAFNAAKELGTVEAWNAFLRNYATGYHADLARAYLKKLGDPAADVPSPADDFPVAAGSWGGIVRDGPGQNYRRIDTLVEGRRVTLIERTDVVWNGFPWFKIAYGKKGHGYQWGGILCSTGAERAGIYETCPPPPSAKSQGPPPHGETRCALNRPRRSAPCLSEARRPAWIAVKRAKRACS
ncbi:SH3 domain-containing protein [Hyphomicrobium facile]|nr:SH3 domain-containing protein [Hyphomicrobium facile]